VRGINRRGTKWTQVTRLAERQHGVVSRRQLNDLAISDGSIEKAVLGGRLHPAFRGAFGLGIRPKGRHARVMAAVLACGEGTVVSHLTAAHLLGLRDRLPAVVDVIAPKWSGRAIDGIRRHFVSPPTGHERGHCMAIPCTSPARTIVDLAGIVGERSLQRAVERAAILRVLDAQAIERLLAAKRRRGGPMLRAILQPWGVKTVATTPGASTAIPTTTAPYLRSELEARLLALIKASDLPIPTCNQRVEVGTGQAKIEVDFFWPQQRVIVETDGKAVHDNPLAFERDRKRDRELLLSGYRVARFTHRQVEKEPEAVIAAIGDLVCGNFG
jgi:predicted transcriptional regulator of viral defense system